MINRKDPHDHRFIVEVELTTKCTIGCVMCPRNLDRQNRSSWDFGHMPMDTVKKLLADDCISSLLFVGCYGDAIYHPNFIEIMQVGIESGKYLHIETNGSHRSEAWWDRVSELSWNKKHKWIFSIDGTPDINHVYRKNSDWNSIEYGIQKLASAINRPSLRWKYIIFPYNANHVNAARTLSAKLGFDEFVTVKSMRDYSALPLSERRLLDMDFVHADQSKM